MNDWPFDQPPNCAVVSIRQIVFGGDPILHVTHDEDDHGWQFLGLQTAVSSDAAIVALSEIVDRDPTVRGIADLPPGWHAWRESVNAAWQRAQKGC
jgi:hypothetical protein